MRVGSDSGPLGMSIGIAYSSTGRMGAERLLVEADQAMYEAKVLDRSSWVLRELDLKPLRYVNRYYVGVYLCNRLKTRCLD